MATATKTKPRSTSKAKQSRAASKPASEPIEPTVGWGYVLQFNQNRFDQEPDFGELWLIEVLEVRDFGDRMPFSEFCGHATKNVGRFLVTGNCSERGKLTFFWNDVLLDEVIDPDYDPEPVAAHQQPFCRHTLRGYAHCNGNAIPLKYTAGPTVEERLEFIADVAHTENKSGIEIRLFSVGFEAK